MIIMTITRLNLHDDVNELVDGLFTEEIVPEPIPTTQEEIVPEPIPTTQVEIVHLPNVPSLGIVLPMAPKKRKMFHEVHDMRFESCQWSVF